MANKQTIEIIIVEDQKDYGQILKTVINDSPDLQCNSIYTNGEVALINIPKQAPDIVLVDIGLPGMSGIELIQQLKEKIPKIQFMVITISEDDNKVFAALAAGANSYLLKGSMLPYIVENIKELHDGGSPMSAQIARKVVKFLQKSSKFRKNPYQDLLTKREQEVLGLIAKGMTYKQVAAELFISIETVKSHCHNVYEKLHVPNKTQALKKLFGHDEL